MGIPYPAGEALTCQQIRELDVLAIEHVGIPGIVLMENAGRSIAEFVYAALVNPETARVLVLCGAGNNGGDGFVVARHLHNAGVHVDVALALPPEKAQGDAATNLKILGRMDMNLLPAHTPEGLAAVRVAAEAADVIVDALLGTGSRGAPRETVAELIRMTNGLTRTRHIAIDIPSGLDADTGTVNDPCFTADATVTMVAPKVGLATPEARAVTGRVVVVDIGAPRSLIPGREKAVEPLDS